MSPAIARALDEMLWEKAAGSSLPAEFIDPNENWSFLHREHPFWKLTQRERIQVYIAADFYHSLRG